VNPNPDHPNLRIRIQEKLKFEPQHSIARFSDKQKNRQTFSKMLVQRSSRQKEILVSFKSDWKRNGLRIKSSFSPIRCSQEQKIKKVALTELRSGRQFLRRCRTNSWNVML
jgi:hypothetical protein